MEKNRKVEEKSIRTRSNHRYFAASFGLDPVELCKSFDSCSKNYITTIMNTNHNKDEPSSHRNQRVLWAHMKQQQRKRLLLLMTFCLSSLGLLIKLHTFTSCFCCFSSSKDL
jgi:hypothetical protein